MALRARSVRIVLGVTALVAALALGGWVLAQGSSNGPSVLLVGTYHGAAGQYSWFYDAYLTK